MKEIYGWIKPSGDIIWCSSYGHIQCLTDDNDALNICYMDLDIIRSSRENCEYNIENNEHPAWHNYESTLSDYSYSIKEKLTEAGFIRFGSYNDNIHFEMSSEFVDRYYQRVKDFAEEFESGYKIEIV